MSDPTRHEPSTELLKIVAHDLLAPLTAVKWQLELLSTHRSLSDDAARRYREGMRSSVELGIVLTKYAYLAGKVLQEEVTLDPTLCSLSTTLRAAVETVRLQYERHGLTLETTISDEPNDRSIDAQFVSFYVWVVTKYFLTCAPTGSVVHIEGARGATDGVYVLRVSATTVPNAEMYGRIVREDRDITTLDQSALFAWLLRAVAVPLGIQCSVQANDTTLSIENTFHT